jgi:hypothetical protein
MLYGNVVPHTLLQYYIILILSTGIIIKQVEEQKLSGLERASLNQKICLMRIFMILPLGRRCSFHSDM